MNRRRLLITAAAAAAAASSATAASRRFTVEVKGSGPDVILIPGLMSSTAVWAETAARLAPRHRVHLIQVGGFAGAPAGSNATGPLIGPLAQELGDYIGGLGRPAAVIGHSMGGFMGVLLAARRPEVVERVLVVDSLSFYPLLFNPTITPETALPQARMAQDSLANMRPEAFEAMQRNGVREMSKSKKGQEAILAWTLASDRTVAGQAMYDITTTDARPELPRVNAPVTVLYAYAPEMPGSAAVLDEIYARAYAGLANKTLKRIDDSFHFIMFDQPQRFAAEVDAFLA